MSQAHALERVPESLPLLPLKDVVIFPHMILPIFISEDICLRAVEEALSKDRRIFLSAFQCEYQAAEDSCDELAVTTPAPFDVYDMGTVASILRTRKLPDGRTKVLIQGQCRAKLVQLKQVEPFPRVQLQVFPEISSVESQMTEGLVRGLKEQLEKVVTSRRRY